MRDIHIMQIIPVFFYLVGLLRIRFWNGGWGWYRAGTYFIGISVWFMDDVLETAVNSFSAEYDEAAKTGGFVIVCGVILITVFYFLTKYAIQRRNEEKTEQSESSA